MAFLVDILSKFPQDDVLPLLIGHLFEYLREGYFDDYRHAHDTRSNELLLPRRYDADDATGAAMSQKGRTGMMSAQNVIKSCDRDRDARIMLVRATLPGRDVLPGTMISCSSFADAPVIGFGRNSVSSTGTDKNDRGRRCRTY